MLIQRNDPFPAIEKYRDKQVAVKDLRESRFLSDLCCSKCGSKNIVRMDCRDIWRCRSCRHQFSETVGTVMHGSHIPLGKWMSATWLLANSRGITSVRMGELLSISQSTTWSMLQRINKASDKLEAAGIAAPARYVAWQKSVKEIPEHYPYSPSIDSATDSIVKAVHEMVSRDCPYQMRADVSQELLLRIFAGSATLENARDFIPELRKDNWLYVEKFHSHVSINAPVYEDGTELGETLLLHMEKNFISAYDEDAKTGEEWRSTAEDRFGEVIARY